MRIAAAMGNLTAAQELEGPDCPESMLYIWELFAAFPRESASKPAITWAELAAYEAVAGIEISPFEASCLFELDGVAMKMLAPKPKAPKGMQPGGPA